MRIFRDILHGIFGDKPKKVRVNCINGESGEFDIESLNKALWEWFEDEF